MSTASVSSHSLYSDLQSYFCVRNHDLQKLGKDLQSGDLAAAQQEFAVIQNLGKDGPVPNGNPFFIAQRESDFEAIGSALQSGDLAAATQAFAQLRSTFQRPAEPPVPKPCGDSLGGGALGSASDSQGASISVTA